MIEPETRLALCSASSIETRPPMAFLCCGNSGHVSILRLASQSLRDEQLQRAPEQLEGSNFVTTRKRDRRSGLLRGGEPTLSISGS